MLTSVTRKLCPLILCSLAVISCGKKASEAEYLDVPVTEPQLPRTYSLGYLGETVDHEIPGNANIHIPTEVNIIEGNVSGSEFTITYNLDLLEEEFEYKCVYAPSPDATLLLLDGCQDNEGRDFGDVGMNPFRLVEGKSIRMEMTKGSPSDLVLLVEYNINWK